MQDTVKARSLPCLIASTHSKDLASEFILTYVEQNPANPTQFNNSTNGLVISLPNWQLPDSASCLSAALVDSNILAIQYCLFSFVFRTVLVL